MTLDFEKGDGLVPVVIQHADSLHVLMLGYMNAEALEQTRREGKVTFFSRSKNRLWTKGESSGNFLWVSEIREDCDSDALLVKVRPEGPVCHTGAASCFREESPKGFLYELEQTIAQRI
ncbi:MAG TPA: phosphoribosyl-AMP cyclohydrolase, partial [Saprospiraceae bacterium]|nr:phosphoribosyl-AMP cyclohydrolase [Saprospiraceae bacterium]